MSEGDMGVTACKGVADKVVGLTMIWLMEW